MSKEAQGTLPPRLVPDKPFPPYAYLPGRNPHPVRDPEGHSYAAEPPTEEPPDPEDWRACEDYLYGIDLFNHGYYWEAHEAWEGLWHACGRRGLTATYLQALINFAAAGFKARWGNARGMRANARTAAKMFESAVRQLGSGNARYMGLDVQALERWASGVAEQTQAAPQHSDTEAGAIAFGYVLSPE